jgi:two-component system, chemotaxis family, protein-glutamate methylesterase/glutaminase
MIKTHLKDKKGAVIMPIKVLVVDDSILMRKLLKDILSTSKDINVIGVAKDAYEAREMISKNRPDVITLDIEMPKMDGITFLKNLMRHYPIPTVVISSLSVEGSDTAMEALQAGAADVIEKPSSTKFRTLEEVSENIIEKVIAASQVKPKNGFLFNTISKKNIIEKIQSDKIFAIGASTGGPEAVYKVLENLPEDYYGTIVTIHMPAGFTKSYAERLNRSCKMEVKEAEDGDKVYQGRVLIAPGDYQMYLKKNASGYYVSVKKDPIYNHHRPAVDPMFFSATDEAKKNLIALIMTGMGKDGAEGIAKIRENGGYTIAQDEKSSIVFGMPKAAIELGGINKIISLENITRYLIELKNGKGGF